MKYLMLIYGNEEIWGSLEPDAFAEFVAGVDAFNARLRASGELLQAEGLVGDPRTVRRVDGVPVVSEGTYLEAKEHVGSMSILDVADHERALEIVKEYPGLLSGGLELWPLMSHGTAA